MKNSFPSVILSESSRVILSVAKNLAMLSIAAVMFVACGGDNGSSAKDDEIDSSSSGVILSDSDIESSGTSSPYEFLSSSEEESSSSVVKSSSSAKESSSSSEAKSSSSSVKESSSSVKVSSSSGAKSSSSVVKSSSSSVKISSSSEYVPFDHILPLGYMWQDGAYKRFTDERNGRSYYYITIEGETPGGVDASVTIMAENLNIGTMVNGENDQNDDDVIERYCYNNDTTKCDEFGGLYQWAEMMALPSRCNTESCADLIENKHQGICPDGWRLMTYRDFYIAWHAKTNTDGIAGVRSSWGFTGSNESGLSLTGAGIRKNGAFNKLKEFVSWYYPTEYSEDATKALYEYVSTTDHSPTGKGRDVKTYGVSVRCVKAE